MGRGRQKAKHTKVARELKYFSPNTDLTALEREIGHPDAVGAQPDYEDKWADLYPEEDDSDSDDSDGDDSEGAGFQGAEGTVSDSATSAGDSASE